MHYRPVSDADEDQVFLNPLMWWVWLLMGFMSLGITVAVAAAYGVPPLDLLLFRRDDSYWQMSMVFDYAVIALGLYLMVRQALSKPEP